VDGTNAAQWVLAEQVLYSDLVARALFLSSFGYEIVML
jgi:hypothetical protein